jgi:hypothetical protein
MARWIEQDRSLKSNSIRLTSALSIFGPENSSW